MAYESQNTKGKFSWGIVKILTDRGLGAITPEGQKADLYFHSKELMGVAFDDLRVGDLLSFYIVEGEKGPAAVEVTRNGGPRIQDELQVVTPDLFTPSGSTSAVAIEFVKAINDALVQRLCKNPTDLPRLHPKIFEELVVEIFRSEGCTAELIQSWNQADGGVDIIAVRRDVGGFPVRYAIQCKRYAAHRRVTAEPIRSLAGVLDHFQAHVGVVATTSFFTRPAREEAEGHFWNIHLRDFESIVASLKRLQLLKQ